MKKTINCLVSIVMLISFTSLTQAVPGKEKGQPYVKVLPHHSRIVKMKGDIDELKAKRARYKKNQLRKSESHSLTRNLHRERQTVEAGALDNTLGVSIIPDEDSLGFVSDYTGDMVFMGVATNTGTSSAVFVKINVTFLDSSGGVLGTDFTYLWGGTNVQTTGGIFINALGAGQHGFFKVWSSIPYSSVDSVEYSFSHQTYGHSPALASVDFLGNPTFSDYSGLKVTGTVKNSSGSYLTYFTKVAFAIFNSSDEVIDVDFTYVDGPEYQGYHSSLSPGASAGILNYFGLASYSASETYINSFEWDEVRVSGLPETSPPFGSMDTPVDGSTVASSIAVTGWALDDTGISSVKIYRESGGSLIYIGDAQFVEGARPDVAAAYSTYPNNTSAGWGYMLLTNFLPNSGNGTFTLYAIANDAAGKSTTLGGKTITCDNAHAVKPFGAIDTPTQGGTASGSSFINWGWALTPQPNSIKTDGSTINVFIDGKNYGHPSYNVYRVDIATLFPGYANTDGAIGYFFLDTSAETNGLHTIQWTARDTAGNSDGIGSRYFTISNNSRKTGQKQSKKAKHDLSRFQNLPSDNSPVHMIRGFNENAKNEALRYNKTDAIDIDILPLERIKVKLSPDTGNSAHFDGYLVSDGQLLKLPIGSSLDNNDNTFYWMLGPGFRGNFPLVFIKTSENGTMSRINLNINVTPEDSRRIKKNVSKENR